MIMKPIDIVVAGHICLDIIPKFGESKVKTLDKILIPGKLVNVFEPAISTGGSVSNTGLALFKLGGGIEFMAKVGDDLFGNAIVDIMRQKTGMESKGMSRVKGEFTSYTIVIAPPGIDRVFLHSPGTNNTFGYDDINFEVVKKAKIFHLGYPPLMRKLYLNDGKELIKIYKKVKEVDATTSLDLSLPDPNSESGKVNWDRILKELLPYVDIFLPSIEESCFMVNKSLYQSVKQRAGTNDTVDYFSAKDYTSLSDIFFEYGAKIVSLKSGHRGLYLRTQNKTVLNKMGYAKPKDINNWSDRELWASVYHVEKIASATGSGDSAVAGFLMAFLRGKSIEETIKCANAAGAQNLRAYDAVSGTGTWDEIQEMIKDKKTRSVEMRIDTPGWWWDKVSKIWMGPRDKGASKE